MDIEDKFPCKECQLQLVDYFGETCDKCETTPEWWLLEEE